MKNKVSVLIEKHKDILQLLNSQKSQSAMLVGGCVRDFLMYGKISEDTDISTTLTPDEVKDLLWKWKTGNKMDDVVILDRDKQYGTIVVLFNGVRYEITTTRADIACFGRQAKVEFCQDFQADSMRRDFTMNALYLSIDGEIFDYHEGLQDLQQSKVVFIGDADKRIKEDYLRILRFFRFSTKFDNFDFDGNILSVLKENIGGLANVSRERVKNEIWKMLSYSQWFAGLQAIKNSGFIKDVFSLTEEAQMQNNYNMFYDNKQNVEGKEYQYEVAKLLYFFKYNEIVVRHLFETLKFTNHEKKIAELALELMSKTNQGTIFSVDVKLKLFHTDNKLVEQILPILSNEMQMKINNFYKNIKPLPITSQDLIQQGFQGKQLGEKIKQLEIDWVDKF